MAEIKNSLKVSAPITPYTTEDNYPTHLAEYGKGGLRTVSTLEDRNAIPEERREVGMQVYVEAEDMIYALRGGIQNNKWVELESFIGGSGSAQVKIDGEPENPTASTIWLNRDTNEIFYRDNENSEWVQYIPPLIDGGEF